MRYLIYGAGTIGLTYGWLLSQKYDVDFLVRPERIESFSDGVIVSVKDLKNGSTNYTKTSFFPHCVTAIEGNYDGILVTVNRCQLQSILPSLSEKQQHTKYFAFMQNNWNMKKEIAQYLPESKYIVAFPSSVGGGRDNTEIEVILFNEATRLGGQCRFGINNFQEALTQVGIKTDFDNHIFDWLKVHYLQQSITAGAVLENGSFEEFARNYGAVKKMVKAFREGIAVCKLQGVNTNKAFPANLFKLPTCIVAHTMQKMFLEKNTKEMVNNHMKKGLPEWIAGYQEVLANGLNGGLPMTVWKSYDDAVEKYLQSPHDLQIGREN